MGSIQWDDTAHDVFIFRRLSRFMMFTGFRLVAEIVNNGSGEIMFLTYGRLFWCVDHVMIAKPSRPAPRHEACKRRCRGLPAAFSKPDQ